MTNNQSEKILEEFKKDYPFLFSGTDDFESYLLKAIDSVREEEQEAGEIRYIKGLEEKEKLVRERILKLLPKEKEVNKNRGSDYNCVAVNYNQAIQEVKALLQGEPNGKEKL